MKELRKKNSIKRIKKTSVRAKGRLAQLVIISLGSSAYSHTLTQKSISIGGLFNNLKKYDSRGPYHEDKKDGKYFIFASFKTDVRNAIGVKQYYGATIDLDDTNINPQYIHNKLKRYIYCLYTTYSHKIKGNRYRVVIPYKVPLNPSDHVDMILYLMDILGCEGFDLSAKTLSLPAYLPAVNDENEEHRVYKANTTGLLLNPFHPGIQDKIPELRFDKYNQEIEDTTLDLNKEVVAGERNGAIARIAGKFLGQGIAKDDLYDLVYAFNEKKVVPPLDEKEVATIVKSIIKTHSRNHNDLVWGFDEIMRRVSSKESVQDEYPHLCRILAYGKLHKKFTPAQLEMLMTELKEKSKVTKKTINSDIVAASHEIQGQDEEILEEAVQDQAENLKERFKNWVYIGSEDRLYRIDTGEYLKREAFNAMFNSPDLKVGIFTLLTKYNIITKVSRVEFNPQEQGVFVRDRIKYVNSYVLPQIEPDKGNTKPLTEHFQYLFPKRRDRKHILDFIAHLVQYPGKKIRWMLVIKGSKGIGKTLIAEKVVLNIIGMSNVGKVTNKLIQSEFNAWQLNRQLVVFEELNIGTTHREKVVFTEALKSFITDDIITAHKKGLDPYDVLSKSCCMGFTNTDNPVVISLDERRFGMYKTEAKPKSREYYEEFVKYCDSHREAMLHYFLNRDISGFQYATAPDTNWGAELKADSVQWPGSVLLQLDQTGWNDYDIHGCLTYGQIVDLVREFSTGKYKLMADDLRSIGSNWNKIFARQLAEIGLRKYKGTSDGRVYVKGKKQTVWILPKLIHRQRVKGVKSPAALGKCLDNIEIKEPEDWGDTIENEVD